MRSALYFILIISPIFFTGTLQSAEIEVIPLKFRTPSEIIPVITPLLDPDGTVTGMNNQLIIKSSPLNISDIKNLLAEIDKKPRRLIITVTNEITGTTSGTDYSAAGKYSSGNLSLENRNLSKNRTGAGVSVSDNSKGNINIRLNADKGSIKDRSQYQLQTLEGQSAFIDTGQLVPVSERTVYATSTGLVTQDSTVYQNVTSGFYVVPHINGEIVSLQISPYSSRLNPDQRGVVDVQNMETTIQGYLGEWMEIGGIEQESYRDGSGILYKRRTDKSTARSVLLKVEEIK